ncbi:hypothetical protein KDL01_24745 [Actinospica durhamensis]|uniref:TRAM domain-containing protein n=1 Tax=Actinospica durhamensis TaxID=1508375 RepID=A0A941EQA2_9ACTN|nr:hypothetical protein [Actinospica durhamensis]MBR7836510.1 hypothetical protein [Actinospica durhamensis]
MSSRNEGEEPEYAADPTRQFDAFRARQADDRAQQETQSPYVFPDEYAADPAAVFPEGAVYPDESFGPGTPEFGGQPDPGAGGGSAGGARWGGGPGGGGRLRSVAIFAGVAVLAIGVGFGAYEAFGSSGSTANVTAGSTATPAAPAATPSVANATKHGRVVEVRVVIESIGTDSITGHLVATGEPVTVEFDASTHFGTTAHPFSSGQLSIGETVVVRGRRTAADILTATIVVGT